MPPQFNPQLTAVALELHPAVESRARQWHTVEPRAQSASRGGDLRQMAPTPDFDIAMMHNNIYYFPTLERAAVLIHLAKFLKPGGRVLLTSFCRGYSRTVPFNCDAGQTKTGHCDSVLFQGAPR